jgi:hypothetical protein
MMKRWDGNGENDSKKIPEKFLKKGLPLRKLAGKNFARGLSLPTPYKAH